MLQNPQDEDFSDSLRLLLKALETKTVPEIVPSAAYDILKKIDVRTEDGESQNTRQQEV